MGALVTRLEGAAESLGLRDESRAVLFHLEVTKGASEPRFGTKSGWGDQFY